MIAGNTGNTGDRNWLVLTFVVFFLGLISLDISLILSGSLDERQWILIAGGVPLWVVLLLWFSRIFVRSRRFYCSTPACAITGRKRVFVLKGDQCICTQCKRPLPLQVLTHPKYPQQLIDAASFSGSLGDTFLGGVAGLRIYRFKGAGEVSIVSGWHNPWGYGIYFTEGNLIGVSYTRYLSRAYYPGWILSFAWIALLASALFWFGLTRAQELPSLWIPTFPIVLFGSMIMSLVFLLFLSPKRASNQIDRIQVNSIRDLETLRKDITLSRDEISEINFRRTKVFESGHGKYSSGSILSISSKRGQPVIFVTTNRQKFDQLVLLFQGSEQDPPINITAN